MNLARAAKILTQWSKAKNPPTWSEVVSLLETHLGFAITPDGGSRYKLYHESLKEFPGMFSDTGVFTIDKPHKKGDPLDKGAFKKLLGAARHVLDSLKSTNASSPSEENPDSETDH
ncbi:type II toxin-antitoxin system HicA family toxin [bacterium]|nr:type II toxin-antitoxin system HicA family toxin [bacterium]